jgi:hypothetical protein
MSPFAFQASEKRLFPTLLLSLQFQEVDALNDEIYRFFSSHGAFQAPDYLQHGDAENLLGHEMECPALGQLRAMFVEGFKQWVKAEKINGMPRVDMFMFANFARPGEFTVVHNHAASHVAAVYYVRVPNPAPAAEDADGAAYWSQENGVLILHDPRFNANIAYIGNASCSEIIHPNSGQMVFFPSYLWHSVTPNRDNFRRLSIACNFYVDYASEEAPYHFQLKE